MFVTTMSYIGMFLLGVFTTSLALAIFVWAAARNKAGDEQADVDRHFDKIVDQLATDKTDPHILEG